jgi:WXXGXW repeat (2 copies)
MKKVLLGTMLAAALVGLPALAQAQIVIATAPPPLQAETPSPVTGPGMTWIPGHWMWNGQQHIWAPGHWDRPPMMGARWVPARWVRRGPMWMYQPGRWRGNRGWIETPPGAMVPPGMAAGVPVGVAQPVMAQPQQPMMMPPPVQPGVVVAQPQQPGFVVAQPQQQQVIMNGPGGVMVGQPGVYVGRHGRRVVLTQPGVPVAQPVQPGVVVAQPTQPGFVVAQPGVPMAQPVQQAPRTLIIQH